MHEVHELWRRLCLQSLHAGRKGNPMTVVGISQPRKSIHTCITSTRFASPGPSLLLLGADIMLDEIRFQHERSSLGHVLSQ